MKHNGIGMESPAGEWREGFPMGNGFMGQVLYGQPFHEVVELSELSFFSGSDSISPYRENAAEAFEELRRAAAEADWERVSALTVQFMGKRGNYGTNLPVGRLRIDFERQGQAADYRRELDLERAVAKVSFGRSKREAFCSWPDRVFAMLFTEDGGEGMSFRLSFDGGELPGVTFCGQDYFGFREQALETVHSDGTEGVRLTGFVCPRAADGEVTITDSGIEIKNSHRVVLYTAMDTDYSPAPGARTAVPERELYRRAGRTLAEYEELRERHVKDVSEKMGRLRLALGGEGNELTELMFQYGRYLFLCSSREDSPLPAPLQGVWNDGVACRIGWTCDMHLDINTQMNYWISEAGNLGECHAPVFRWMEKRLIPNGRKNAQGSYGRPGWAAELVSNAWGYAAPYWDKSLSPCPTGGIWQASDYMERFRYGKERSFLEEHVYPVLREAVEFFLSYVYKDGGGRLTCGPSISPENVFLAEGKKYYASNGCTYEILMIRELFAEYLEAWEELTERKEPDARQKPASPEEPDARENPAERENSTAQAPRRDAPLAESVREALDRLLPYRILPDGTLAEWSHDYPSADLQHRHTSHLLGLFPYGQITPEGTPELAGAAERSIEAKLTPPEGWEDTGWARALLALYSARLYKGEEAYRHLCSMQERLTGPNLLVMHPPTRGTGSFYVYELDGNTGFSMAVLEMLVQSHNGVIRLLPALPDAWKSGSLAGVPVRGGVELDLEWRDGRPARVEARARVNGCFRFAFGGSERIVRLEAGRPELISF